MSKSDDAPVVAQASARSMTGAEWSMLLVLSVLWGGSFLFNGIALKEVPVFTIVAFRLTFGALALHLVIRVSGITIPMDTRSLLGYLGMALLNGALPFSLIAYGQTLIPSGLASILNATVPIFTMLLAHFLIAGEPLTGRRVIGVLLGFAGVVVLSAERAFSGAGEWIGFLACIAAALSYALSNMVGRRLMPPGANPIALAAGQLSVGALIILPVTIMVDNPFAAQLPGLASLFALIMLALVSTATAYILFFRLLALSGATNASLVTLLIPCWSILLGTVFLGERLGLQEVGGFAVIALGLLVIDGRLVALFRRKRVPD